MLFASSFLSATLLPGSSEAVLLGLLVILTTPFWPAIGVATLGNTLGALTSHALGRLLPRRADTRVIGRVSRYGSAALVLSWMPVVDDALCVAADWLRLNV